MSRWSKNVRNRRFDSLSRVDWREFERLLADYYRRQGFGVEHCGTGASASRFDGGIDLKLFRDDAYVVVQCKHWNARQVTHNAVHELAGITLTEGASGAILITSGEFTPHAVASAEKLGSMTLVDGDALREMLGVVPEPVAAPSESEDRAARILTEVGERVLHSAERRVRHGAKQATHAAMANFIWIPLAKFGLLVLVTLAFVWFLSRTAGNLNQQLSALGSSPSPAAPVSTEPVPPVLRSPSQLAPERDNGHLRPSPPPYERPQLTEAEIREQQRLADEAIRVLAPNTPEMDMGEPVTTQD